MKTVTRTILGRWVEDALEAYGVRVLWFGRDHLGRPSKTDLQFMRFCGFRYWRQAGTQVISPARGPYPTSSAAAAAAAEEYGLAVWNVETRKLEPTRKGAKLLRGISAALPPRGQRGWRPRLVA